MRYALKEFLNTYPGGVKAFAALIGLESDSYLSQMIHDHRPIPPELCVVIEEKSDRQVSRMTLHKNARRIWPELAEKETT